MDCSTCGYDNPKGIEICQRCGSKLAPPPMKAPAGKVFELLPADIRVGLPPAMGAALLTVALFIPGPDFILFHASTFGRIFLMLNGQGQPEDWIYLLAGLAALSIPISGMMGMVIYFNPLRFTRQALRFALAGLIGLGISMAVFVWEMFTAGSINYLYILDFMFALGGLLLILLHARKILAEEAKMKK